MQALQVRLSQSMNSQSDVSGIDASNWSDLPVFINQFLQKHARVECGFAAVNDVRTGKHEDRMDSFVLSETLKYLFLIFADPSELILDLDNFIFTTEAHLLPLSLGQLTNVTNGNLQ